MGFAKQKGCSTKKLMVHNFEELKEQFLNVTVRAKTSLVHTSKFATLAFHNFCWVRHTDFKFTGLLVQISLYHSEKLSSL